MRPQAPAPTTRPQPVTGFLSGYRVLDLTDERGLMAGRILADLGADVVQVEAPGGSTARRRAPRHRDRATGRELDGSYLWDAYAANKRGVAADLGAPGGQALVRSLAGAADVLVESEGPGIQGRRGLDYDDLRAVNPRLVYVSVTPFGRTGPKAGYAACDLTVWAAGGPLDEHRDGDRPPVRISVPQAFRHASADAAAGAQLALLARARTGQGQLVDVSAQASLGIATLGHVLAYAVGDVARDMSRGHALGFRDIDNSGSGSGTDPALKKWPCRDGLIEFHIGIGAAAGGFTNAFIAWMADEGAPVARFAAVDFREVPELIKSGKFTDADTAELRAAVAAFLAGQTKQDVVGAALARKLLCVPVFGTADVRTSRQLASRGFFVTSGDGDRATELPGPFACITGGTSACGLRRPAPLVGEHTDEVRAEWLGRAEPVRASIADPLDCKDPRPLGGLRVLDLSWVVAGPVIGRALADFGATVVRVESSKRIETARFMQPFQNGTSGPENSALYSTWNAGKLGVTLDLRTEAGRQVAADLARWADVVIESFSPGLMARWGLDYGSLSEGRPGLIMLSTSINGQTGPLSRLAGYGNVGAALSGFQAIVGWPDREPFGPFGPYTDYLGPRFALCALLAAIERRNVIGQGCYIDISQVEAGVWFQAPEMADNAATGAVVTRAGNRDREHAPHGVYPCRPDPGSAAARYVAVAATTDAQWEALARVIGRQDLSARKRYRTAAGRRADADDLDAAVAAWTRQHSAAEAERFLQGAGVPAHISASSRDFCLDPQLEHRGHLVALPHPRHGTVTVEGPRYLLSATPGCPRAAAPTFGQHNEYVLRNLLGYDETTVSALREAEVLR